MYAVSNTTSSDGNPGHRKGEAAHHRESAHHHRESAHHRREPAHHRTARDTDYDIDSPSPRNETVREEFTLQVPTNHRKARDTDYDRDFPSPAYEAVREEFTIVPEYYDQDYYGAALDSAEIARRHPASNRDVRREEKPRNGPPAA